MLSTPLNIPNKNRAFDPASTIPLPLQDAFRTIDWGKIKEELESFSIRMPVF
jgi:hypothetical protein